MITLDGKEVKVGDRLWCLVYGWGKVLRIDNDSMYPIILGIKVSVYSFSVDGKLWTDQNRVLFWNEIKFDIPKPPKEKIKKWKWVMRLPSVPPHYFVTKNFYSDAQKAEYACFGETAILPVLDSEIEVDE